MKKSLFVFGGNSGANIVFEIGKKSYKQIFYTNTYANTFAVTCAYAFTTTSSHTPSFTRF